jgi:hypothetical protein
LARAKQTGRAEARRKYRQSVAPDDVEGHDEVLEADDDEPARPAAKVAAPAKASGGRPPTGRVGFVESFRLAYHPPNLREDLRTLPKTVRNRGFLAAVALVIVGGAIWYLYPVYTGSLQAWQLLVFPGSAFAPQLVAGFFAPRASYLLGLLIGLLQPIVYLIVDRSQRVQDAYIARGVTVPEISVEQLLPVFLNTVVTGILFAAMAAWYRRFLSLSSQRSASAARAAAAARSGGRGPSKPPSRRTASR